MEFCFQKSVGSRVWFLVGKIIKFMIHVHSDDSLCVNDIIFMFILLPPTPSAYKVA